MPLWEFAERMVDTMLTQFDNITPNETDRASACEDIVNIILNESPDEGRDIAVGLAVHRCREAEETREIDSVYTFRFPLDNIRAQRDCRAR